MKIKSLEHLVLLIGNKLATLRLQKGYDTIKDFAQKFDLPQIQYWRLENGKTNPTVGTIFKLMSIHKMSVQDFFCDLEKFHQPLTESINKKRSP